MAKSKKATVVANIASNSEGRWISIFENMKEIVMVVDSNCKIQTVNRVEHGFTREMVIGQDIFYFVTPDKAQFIKQNIANLFKTGKPFEVEDYIKGPDGLDAWYYSIYSPIVSASGKIDEFMVITRNITDLKRAEHIVINSMVNGQEEERKRVAGELHDGLGQNLSALNLNLMHLEADLKKLNSPKTEKTFVHIKQLIGKAGAELKAISHNLAPPMLVKLGLVKALDEYCSEAGKDYGVKINFKAENISKGNDDSLDLAVFRMTQELIYNSIKYSDAKKISVVISNKDNSLSLIISDKGKGFDPSKNNSGLGLQNVKTRAKLHKGEVYIISKPGNGTEIKVKIPLQ